VSRLNPIPRRGRRQRIKPGWTENPQAFAICDRCGLPCMHDDLRPDRQFRGGMTPVRTGLMVCGKCEDVPNAYFQKQVLRPDPPPLKNPRPDDRGDGFGAYPEYATGALPDPGQFPAGYQINVTGLPDSPVRAYADTIDWRRVDTNATVT